MHVSINQLSQASNQSVCTASEKTTQHLQSYYADSSQGNGTQDKTRRCMFANNPGATVVLVHNKDEVLQ